LIDHLRSGALDMAIVSVGSGERPDGLNVETITDEAIDAAVRHDDALAGQSSVGLTALAGRSLIALPVGTGLRRQLDRACATAGVRVRIAFEASTPIALAELAEHGLGVAILPASVARSRPDLHALTITPEMRGRLVLAWRSSGPVSPAARAVVQMARRLVRVGADQ
jgi:DNA-binding transcriptional LysR family regulator